ncbi:MAG: DUF4934 domain-containing protein [Tannerella sp.]|nr:DUF4934 domain-containing protein [Tannerella sp.]
MKQLLIIVIILLLFSFSVNCQENKAMNPAVIDVESGLKNLSRLKVSDLGKTIRYIPLETPDDGLIGRNPVVKVLKNYIVVEYGRLPSPDVCLLFSKKDGRFIAKIGHAGQDPTAYTNCFSWTDEKEEFLYFERKPNQLIKYDMKGNFCGKIEFSSSGLASYYLITDSKIIGYFDAFNMLNISSGQYSLGIFEKDGSLKDTVPSFFPYATPLTDDIFQINLMHGKSLYNSYGSWIRAGVFIFEYTPTRQVRQVNALHAARIWKNNENTRYKQDFVDTIYTVSGSKLIPSIVFNTGQYHWPVQERRSEKNNSERIFIADISENNSLIFFQCIKGMFLRGEGHVLYNGLYNKKTGKTKLSNNKEGIEDDLTHFMPFKPLGMSTSGEFVSLVEVWDVMEWLEKHPEAKDNKNLSFLKDLDEEMNPIVILIE